MLMGNALQTLDQIKELKRKIPKNKIQDDEILIEKMEKLEELKNAIEKETKERVDFGNKQNHWPTKENQLQREIVEQ